MVLDSLFQQFHELLPVNGIKYLRISAPSVQLKRGRAAVYEKRANQARAPVNGSQSVE